MIIGIGSDIIELERISKLHQRTSAFSKRILTQTEQAELDKKPPTRAIEFLAGRFAAKEAISKALGTGIGSKLSFQDIEILPDLAGKPIVRLHQKIHMQEMLPAEISIHLSISHSRDYCIAQVVIEQM